MAKVLIFRPRFDLATSYGFAWLEQISRIAAGFGHSVLDLAGAEATKEALYDALQNFKPDLVIACSHGSATQFTAQNEEIALTKCYNDQVMSGKQAYFVSCFDEKTEALTLDGFKFFKDLSYDDYLATLNHDGFIEYHKPIAIIKYRYRGNLIHFAGKNYDLLVTPDHNVYCKPVYKESFSFMRADELARRSLLNIELKRDAKWSCADVSTFSLPIPESYPDYAELYRKTLDLHNETGWGSRKISKSLGICRGTVHYWLKGKSNPTKFNGKEVGNVPIDLWLEFFGWYLSEGCCSAGRIIITQSNPDNQKRIIELIKKLGFSPYLDGVHIELHSKQLYEYLKQFGKSHQKYIPSWVKQLPPHRLKVLLNALISGDGCSSGKYTRVYYTTSKRLADDVHEIALKCGYAVSVGLDARSKADFGTYESNILPKYIVYMSTEESTPRMYCTPKYVAYDGMVYDVTVPNHTIYVRRNGKAVWSGNCLVGQELLPSMVEKDAVTVGGYTSEFVWVVDSDYSDKPLEDPYAYPFMRAVVEPCRRLLGGASWREWYDYSIALFNKGVSEWFESTDPNATQIVAGLEHDRDSLVVYGETTIRAVPRRLAVAGVPFLSVVPALLGFVVVEASLEKGF